MRTLERALYLALIVIVLSVAIFLLYGFRNEMTKIRKVQEIENIRHTETKQFLLATIDWSTERQKMILFMRDRIVKSWTDVGFEPNYEKAYRKAEYIINECEKYPNIQPFYLLSIQFCESRFFDSLISTKGAIGSWQIMPSTARLLCDAVGLSYNEKYLYDPMTSTKLAGKLIGTLKATYDDNNLVSADYNGGPWQAFYYKTDKTRLVKETADFVNCVNAKNDEYAKSYTTFKVDATFVGKR